MNISSESINIPARHAIDMNEQIRDNVNKNFFMINIYLIV